AQFEADLNAAIAQYQEALNLAAAGDTAAAEPLAAEAESRILQLCTDNGYPDIESCIGQTLPPLPQPAETPAEDATDAPEADAAAGDVGQPAEETVEDAETGSEAEGPTEVTGPPAADEPAADADAPAADTEDAAAGTADEAADPVDDAMVQSQEDLTLAVELYGIGVEQLQDGDPEGQATIDAANQRIEAICAELQLDVTACLAQFNLTLPEVPEVPEVQPE